MASGVKITDEVKDAFGRVGFSSSKLQRLKYAVFKFNDKVDKIILDSTQDYTGDDGEEDYDTFITNLCPSDDVRYVAYDMKFLNKEGTKTNDVVFVAWNPPGTSIKKKMLVSSSLNSMTNTLTLKPKIVIEASEMSEADAKAVLEKLGGQPYKQ